MIIVNDYYCLCKSHILFTSRRERPMAADLPIYYLKNIITCSFHPSTLPLILQWASNVWKYWKMYPRTGLAPGWIENVCKTMFMGDSKTYMVCLKLCLFL